VLLRSGGHTTSTERRGLVAETISKQKFVERLADKTGMGRREAGRAVEAVLDEITESLKRGDSVSFTGFGKFSTAHRAERQGVNPRSPGQKVTIPAATVPKFSAGTQLKQAVRNTDT
jgi:DNA-binding protein HU-beta